MARRNFCSRGSSIFMVLTSEKWAFVSHCTRFSIFRIDEPGCGICASFVRWGKSILHWASARHASKSVLFQSTSFCTKFLVQFDCVVISVTNLSSRLTKWHTGSLLKLIAGSGASSPAGVIAYRHSKPRNNASVSVSLNTSELAELLDIIQFR